MDEPTAGLGAWVGRSLGRFTILEPIGRGGMGEVYRGWDERLKKPVAIKSLRSTLAQNETARKRFVRETRYACRVDHPYVATVLDVVEEGSDLFLVMEYIEGRRLDRAIEEDHPAPSQVMQWGLEVAEALDAIHRAGLVHRDLKPSNVLVTTTGHVKVMDFGVAYSTKATELLERDAEGRAIDATLTGTGVGVGTIAYMSPEQVRGQQVDARSDLFSFGVVLYEAITGEHPFQRESIGATIAAILHEPPGAGSGPGTLTESGPIRQVVLRLLDKDPARRYATSGELVEDLSRVIRGEALPVRFPEAVRRRSFRWVAATVFAVTAVLTGWWLAKRPPPSGSVDMRPAVVVLPFEDRTGEADGRDRGEMLADLLAANLGDGRSMRTLGSERLEPILAGIGGPTASMADARAALERYTPTRWIVAGRLHKEGESYHAAVDVFRAGAKVPAGSFTVGAGSIVVLADLARSRITSLIAPDTPSEVSGGGRAWVPRVEEAAFLERRARQAFREIRYLEAKAYLEKALELDPDHLPAAILYARVLDAAGFGKLALAAAESALRVAQRPGAPTNPRWLAEARAVQAGARGRLAAATEQRRALASTAPDDPEAWRGLAFMLWKEGKADEGITAVEKAAALDPEDPRIPILRAKLEVARGKPEEAMARLDQAQALLTEIGSEPGLAEVWHERGNVERARSRNEAAKAAYREAVRRYREVGLEGRVTRAQVDDAWVSVILGRFAEAESLYETASDAASVRGDFRLVVESNNQLGASLYSRGENVAAEQRFRGALTEARRLGNPRLALDPMLNLASLLAHTGRAGESAILAREALAAAQNRGTVAHEVMARTLLADAEYQTGRVQEAIDDYEAAEALAARSNVRVEQRFWALDYLTEALDWTCATGRAVESNATAIELAEKSGQRELRAYGLLRRAELRASLAQWAAARQDLAAADALAGSGVETLGDLRPRIVLARGVLASMAGNPAEAEAFLRRAIDHGESSKAHGVENPGRTLLAVVALQRGDAVRGIRLAREVLDGDRATATESVRARSVLARCLLVAGRWDDAAAEARAAFDQATGMGLPLVAAEAASVLVRLPPGSRPADVERVRADGLKALESCETAVPPSYRRGYRERADLGPIYEALGSS